MSNRSKFFIVLAVLIVLVILGFSFKTPAALFKGQIFPADEGVVSGEDALLPDLKPSLEVILPENEKADLQVKATIENLGPGKIDGATSFQYTIYINDTEVFSNTDSYSTVGAGEAFAFTYPISRPIYDYPDSGTLRFVLDSGDDINEIDEDNNEIEVPYNLGTVEE